MIIRCRTRRSVYFMATPVGPTPSDPNDPDLWDWSDSDDEDDEPTARRHPWTALVAALLVLVLVLVFIATAL